MYGIEVVDRLKVKRIAGRIVPAIATTTAAVAGLVTVELVKLLVNNRPLDQYRNAFINLALPMFVLSEPGDVPKTTLSSGVTYTSWDRWEINGNINMTLNQFFEALKAKYHMSAALVVQGSKMIYMPIMPGHNKRLVEPIFKYLKTLPDKPYVDLVVSYQSQHAGADQEDDMGPIVRYYYK